MANLRELSKQPDILTQGHRLCAGCGHGTAVRQILSASPNPLVVGCATGCLEVATTIYPYTSWASPWIHSAFENAAATMSGVEAAYNALKARGKVTEDINFVAFGGDGGTYDIGLQSLSGAAERGHRMLYVCLDNGAYMNTGIQRSSATPLGADTTTSPAGTVIPGKAEHRKDLTAIMIAHDIPYVAQSDPSHWNDLITKAQRAFATDGFSFINVLSPCPRGWRNDTSETIELARLAVDTCFWPLYEVDHGVWKLNYRPREKKPVAEWLKRQGRFRHLFTAANQPILDEIQAHVDRKWAELKVRCGVTD
jgi:pyruvate ferredoxin oxidoreductase beta subunit